MDLSFDITALGIVVMVIGAVVYGLALALVGEVRIGYEWLLTALAAFLGAFVASEYLTLQSFAPVWEGIALVPAVIGGAVTGLVVDLITRFASGGSLTHGPHPV
jgi:uncharacterized membrane protein YeaQ/YmgE (transglycosylase-associated protein family)